eukprot:COSAG06_NODE_693_length_13038_cov_3.976428_5_plen_150_part_00
MEEDTDAGLDTPAGALVPEQPSGDVEKTAAPVKKKAAPVKKGASPEKRTATSGVPRHSIPSWALPKMGGDASAAPKGCGPRFGGISGPQRTEEHHPKPNHFFGATGFFSGSHAAGRATKKPAGSDDDDDAELSTMVTLLSPSLRPTCYH